MEYKIKSQAAAWNLKDAQAGTYAESEYVRVIFVIECPSYYHDNGGIQSYYVGFDTDEERDAFYAAAGIALTECGFNVILCGAVHDKAHLFIHPQEISGSVRKNDVVRIAERLNAETLFSVRWVDVYAEELDISDAEYFTRLDGQADSIRAAILEAAKTKRRNCYHSAGEIAVFVADMFRIPRIGKPDGETSGGYGETSAYIMRRIDSLIDEGYLITARGADGIRLIRTINKAEQRQRKLSIA